MDADLFRFGLSLSKRLDERFGHSTIAAKMTDVPGHTRNIVPLMAEAGIRLLHIGVNEASTMPHVPPVFVWRDEASGSDMQVICEHYYGGLTQVNGLKDALAIHMTWNDKPACRLPVVLWISFSPFAPDGEWRFEKLDRWIDPLKIVSGGNRGLHAVFDRVRYTHANKHFTLYTHDAPLVAPGDPSLLPLRTISLISIGVCMSTSGITHGGQTSLSG